MNVVHQSFEGRYSDNPRALYERWLRERPDDSHLWLAHPAHRSTFPADVVTVTPYDAECVAALEAADIVVANTHTDVEWTKRDESVYLQTWHGTPLKRIHRDVLWAPPGRLDRLDRDIARWDVLLSPNGPSTPRLRRAFGYVGDVWETGYPRNDLLLSPDRDAVRRRVRAEFGIDDDTVVILYAPTWRDDAVFAETTAPVPLALDVSELMAQLGPRFHLLLRVHALQTDRHTATSSPCVDDASLYAEVAELYLAADVLVTDYSSAMFDFAATGKPLLFYVYDFERFRDDVRGVYFDLAAEAPGPLLREPTALIDAVLDLDAVRERYRDRYAAFRDRYCSLEDGRASERVLRRLWTR
ncbi:MAG: CDP-glycerol glycerophosphotransferase family protein [Jatrophihabitans sp.]|uniref:CDP-glycerol glycerophosphotransferase family protein n=1 Tax=Jatrophihabitans sp. TaxID=1932789 RepID=UPI00391640A0